MFGKLSPKRVKWAFRWGGPLLLMAALLFCAFPAALSAEENPATSVVKEASKAEEATAASNPKEAPCKGLKPYNNIDELLYQFYINLESDCLFEMPVEELERMWDIKILSDKQTNIKDYFQLRMGPEFNGKPYSSERDAFYLRIFQDKKTNTNVLEVSITTEYYDKHESLFPDGKYPKYLPDPTMRMNIKLSPPYVPGSDPKQDAKIEKRIEDLKARIEARQEGKESVPQPQAQKKGGKYMMGSLDYYWLSSDQARHIYLQGVGGNVTMIVMRKM